MTVVMIAVMGVMMVGMMFGMHRKHKGHAGKEKPVVMSTSTAPGAEPAPAGHSH